MTPTGMNQMNMLNFGFTEYREVRGGDTSIIDGGQGHGDDIMDSFDAGANDA